MLSPYKYFHKLIYNATNKLYPAIPKNFHNLYSDVVLVCAFWVAASGVHSIFAFRESLSSYFV